MRDEAWRRAPARRRRSSACARNDVTADHRNHHRLQRIREGGNKRKLHMSYWRIERRKLIKRNDRSVFVLNSAGHSGVPREAWSRDGIVDTGTGKCAIKEGLEVTKAWTMMKEKSLVKCGSRNKRHVMLPRKKFCMKHNTEAIFVKHWRNTCWNSRWVRRKRMAVSSDTWSNCNIVLYLAYNNTENIT